MQKLSFLKKNHCFWFINKTVRIRDKVVERLDCALSSLRFFLEYIDQLVALIQFGAGTN